MQNICIRELDGQMELKLNLTFDFDRSIPPIDRLKNRLKDVESKEKSIKEELMEAQKKFQDIDYICNILNNETIKILDLGEVIQKLESNIFVKEVSYRKGEIRVVSDIMDNFIIKVR